MKISIAGKNYVQNDFEDLPKRFEPFTEEGDRLYSQRVSRLTHLVDTAHTSSLEFKKLNPFTPGRLVETNKVNKNFIRNTKSSFPRMK